MAAADSSSALSARMRAAALAERRQLDRQIVRLERARDAALRELERTEGSLRELRARMMLINRLAPDGDQDHRVQPAPAVTTPTSNGARTLQGADIREMAVRVLASYSEASAPIHYRTWYALMSDRGFAIS